MKDPRYPFALEPGTEIGGYLIDRVLGAGGFGITYRGFNEITLKQVAIKEFYVRDISSREGATVVVDTDVDLGTYDYALRKFQEEAQAVVTRFAHPYIIRGENFVRAHNTCYLIMEYVDGSNLDDWLTARSHPPSEADIRPFFEKLFSAVDYVHEHNMMHRDLTPRNIMVRLNGDPVLIDFGAAGLGIDLGRSSKIVAQLRYAPPEQSDDTAGGIHGRYTDVFSLAGVLFRTVTGKTPMAPTSRLARMSQFRGEGNGDPQAPVASLVANAADYSTAFLAGIDRGLILDARLRPQSIAAFRRALGWAEAQDDDRTELIIADAVTAILPPRTMPPEHPRATPIPPAAAIGAADPDATRALTRPPHPPLPPADAPQPLAQTIEAAADRSTADAPAGEAEGATASGPAAPKRRGAAIATAAVLAIGVASGAALMFRADIAARLGDLSGPAKISPYRFSARLDGHRLQITGYAPSEAARTAIRDALAGAASDTIVDDRLALGRGAPPDMLDRIATFARHLPDMTDASFDLVGDQVSVTATAASPAAFAVLKADLTEITAKGDGGLTLLPARVSPYVVKVAIADGTLTLSGFVPDAALHHAATSAAEQGGPVVDHLEIAAGAPDHLSDAVAFAIAEVRKLATGSVTITDRTIDVAGVVRSLADVAGLKTASTAGVPQGFSVTAKMVLRDDVPAQDCDRLALPPDHQDRPAGITGVALDGIDVAAAVPACRQAVTAYPNVRRFLTALGAALQKSGDFNAAAANYRLAISIDDASAMALLGLMLRDGIGMPVDRPAADALFLRARTLDNGTAMFAIGQAYEVGDAGHPRDLEEAAKWYVRASNRDSADANARLGALALAGTLRAAPAPDMAYPAFEKAALMGLPSAMVRFADMNRQGQTPGHVRDYAKAAEWYGRAAALGRTEAMAALAHLYLDGHGVAADPHKAREWMMRAADAGDASAMMQMGRFEFDGIGAPRDPGAAARWFEKAALAGHPESYARLGLLYQNDRADGDKPDYAAAFDWFQKGAAVNDPQALYQLGTLYAGGLGRPADFAQAEGFFQRAGDLGYAAGYFQLGLMSERGRGRPVDLTRAAADYQRAANLGHAPAMIRLGLLTQNGSGVPKDDTAALVDFTKALQLGDAQGYWYAALLTDVGRGAPKNPDRVAGYLLEAYQRHEIHAVTALSGDMASFSVESRVALQRQLQSRGFLKGAVPDGAIDTATHDAIAAATRPATD